MVSGLGPGYGPDQDQNGTRKSVVSELTPTTSRARPTRIWLDLDPRSLSTKAKNAMAPPVIVHDQPTRVKTIS